MAALVAQLLLFGCTESPVESDTDQIFIPPPEADWEPEELQDHIDEGLAYGLPNPSTFLQHYMELYEAGATDACPGTDYNFNSPDVGGAGCTTDDGYFFEGVVEYSEQEDQWALHADFRIIAPDDHHLSGAGNIGLTNSEESARASIYGSFFEDPSTDWLSANPSSLLQIEKRNNESGTLLYGGYTIDGRSFYFENVWLDTTRCDQPIGVVQVRDPNGGWFSVYSEESCPSCPTVTYGGTEIDSVCPDFSILHDLVSAVLSP